MSQEGQKFHKGDHVRVAKDLGAMMAHFASDVEAIVVGSYADQYGGSDTNSYTLHIKGQGQCSWYYGSQLELIEANRWDLLVQWEHERDEERKLKSGLDWIFENGPEVVERTHSASVQALADCLGIRSLWGSRGEGYVYFQNARMVIAAAAPFLLNKDKSGWLAFAEKHRLPQS